jgi:prepilin-type N-terminal cleavage/methylation domain-containing protein
MMREFIRKRGFTLIEINLAIFVVAIGMLTLFSLFPAGLKQIETAHESTQEALFCDYVLATLRADAMLITNATDWAVSEFQTLVVELPSLDSVEHGTVPVAVEYPDAGGDLWMRYILQLGDAGNNLRSASLWCSSGQYGATDPDTFKQTATKFYTQFFYSGMP